MGLYIGLMSGTSADGIDAALVDFSHASSPQLIATYYKPYPRALRDEILALCEESQNEIQRMAKLDVALGKAFAQTVNELLQQQTLSANAIQAIGSHGQTIRHYPHEHFTLQIGDPNIIAAETGIMTIADFRRKDMALGGQGAPLVPAFHHYLFASINHHRAIVNIGGMANVTLLSQKNKDAIIGFDTGPGNTLLDAWIEKHRNLLFDAQGAWAESGKIQIDLLNHLLADHYFQLPPPKSTGREYFNLKWLETYLQKLTQNIAPQDVQATLVELTTHSIIKAISNHFNEGDIVVCGGGTQNNFLMRRLQAMAPPAFVVTSTQQFGIDPAWIEAMAFAWLAQQTVHKQSGNVPSVTGAAKKAILGGIYYG